eukprot:GHVN01082827.1.p1 GENE.GHVN01082827.1~~GHVN01082827.1.p1  ORF type:complete len:200 (+),score=58.59 GHVN01082827.1:287-886(+)
MPPASAALLICPICLDSLTSRLHKTLKCSHSFHQDCISQWVSTSSHPFRSSEVSCPVCRDPINAPSGEPQSTHTSPLERLEAFLGARLRALHPTSTFSSPRLNTRSTHIHFNEAAIHNPVSASFFRDTQSQFSSQYSAWRRCLDSLSPSSSSGTGGRAGIPFGGGESSSGRRSGGGWFSSGGGGGGGGGFGGGGGGGGW